MCVVIFSTNLSETFLILRRNEQCWSSYKAFVILVRFKKKKKLEFSRLIFEKLSNVNFMFMVPRIVMYSMK